MTVFVLTGFGPFGSVTENPSSINLTTLTHRDDVHVITDVRVSVAGVSDCLAKIERLQLPDPVCLHFGVNEIATGIQLERFAYNQALFRIPDADGYTTPAEGEVIDPSSDAQLATAVPINYLIDRDSRLAVSTDPGRYLCNYLYFKSLLRNPRSLFVHVPPYSVMSQLDQVECIERILSLLTDVYTDNIIQK